MNSRATRISAVINPVKLIITNYPEGQVEELEAINNPEDPEAGSHLIEFSRELWMEREDFMEDAPKKYFRMTPGQEVRLKKCLYREMYRLQERRKRCYHRSILRI